MAAVKTAAAALVVLLAGIAAACGGDSEGVAPVTAGSCGDLLYEGEGKPDAIVVTSNPLRGGGAETVREVTDAIEYVFRRRGFRAGGVRVGLQSCDYSVGGDLDASACKRHAEAFVETKAVVGEIGPFNSGCAEIQIPILSRTAAGPLAMVSPANTDEGLTRGPYALPLYHDGVRNYTRLVTHDQGQGAAAAYLARRAGARRAAILAMRGGEERYVGQLTESFEATARALGVESTSFDWPNQESYARLAASVAAARPDVVYLAGLPEQNAKTLIRDLKAELGQIPIITPDSFALHDAAQELGPIGDGLLTTVPGIPHSALPPAGKTFLREFGRTAAGTPGAPEAAQATEVLLDAIARSDGTRASVVEELFATKVENGILGSFTFDRLGDIDPAPVGVYRYEGGKLVVDSVVRAPLGPAD
jgi:branched-chain amino acid transport system substrate-binding protein